jgi:hypothetical protein
VLLTGLTPLPCILAWWLIVRIDFVFCLCFIRLLDLGVDHELVNVAENQVSIHITHGSSFLVDQISVQMRVVDALPMVPMKPRG